MEPLDIFDVQCSSVDWDEFTTKIKPGKLSVMCFNARSILKKFPEFLGLLSLLRGKISFIVITESWLKEFSDKNLEIDGYKSHSIYRNSDLRSRGGGIKIYYLEYFDVSIANDFCFCTSSLECVVLKATVPGFGKLVVSGIYRPPNNLLTEFLEKITNLLELFSSYKMIITGDFNLDYLKPQPSRYATDYSELLASYGFTNVITLPTYISPITNNELSCIDHIWQNLGSNSVGFVIHPNLADHYFVASIFDNLLDEPPITIKFRDFSETNVERFLGRMDDEFLLFDPPISDVNEFTEYFLSFLFRLLDKYFPFKTKTISHKNSKTPWVCKDIKKCIKKKHDWFRLLKRGLITSECYRVYCGSLRYVLKLAEEEYHTRKFNKFSKDVKKNWELLNNMLGTTKKVGTRHFDINGAVVTDSKIISDAFCKYFLEHPRTIRDNISPSTSNFLDLIPMNSSSISFNYTEENEVCKILDSMNNKSSKEDIPSKFLKYCKSHVSYCLAFLFNMCIDCGEFPKKFKLAKITPVHKKGSLSKIENYRPISVTCNASKIFDQLLNTRVQNFFQNNNLLSQNQFGFRKSRSTEQAAMKLIHRILPAISDKLFAVCVFLDFSACFDTIDREILFQKLYRYGVRGVGLNFIKSYFNHREQYVSYSNKNSEILIQNLGVIQGTKNGPSFFDIYSNDLNYLCNEDECILFADDTCLTYAHTDLQYLLNHVGQRLITILDWCRFNKLSINPSKSEFMIVTNRNIDFEPHLRIGNDEISLKHSVKYLGLHIDHRLTFKDQLQLLKTKLSRLCGISYRLSKFFNMSTAKKFYFAFVYSAFIYGISAWGGALHFSGITPKLFRFQEKIVKNLFGNYFPSEACLFKELKLLKVLDIHRFYASIYMFKILKLNECPTVNEDISFVYPEHTYLTRNRNNFIPPFPRVNAIRRNFEFQFLEIWNELPDSVTNSNSLNIFKKRLAMHFIEPY